MRRALLLLLASTLLACGGGGRTDAGPGDVGPPDDGPPPDARFVRILETAAVDLAAANASAVSIAVWVDGEVRHVGGLGTAESLGGRTPDADTQFMIGSDTKKIAALALLQRVERDGFDVDASLRELLPELALPNADPFLDATSHDLLSHQSGVNDFLGPNSVSTTDAALAAFVFDDYADAAFSMNAPGLFWNYSNPNFSLAGLLAERSAGMSWPVIVQDNLLAPLGMARTVARKADVDVDNHASGVGLSEPLDRTIAPVSLERTWEDAFIRPSGLLWSTPSDQMRLAAFLVDGDESVLRDDLREALVTPQVPINPDEGNSFYGYGIFVAARLNLLGETYDGAPVWNHGGNTLTHTSFFFVLPEQRFAISILSNGLGDDFQNTAAAAIQQLVELPEGRPIETPLVDPDGLDALVGTYVDELNVGIIDVSRDGDTLRVSMPDLDEAEVEYDPLLQGLSTRVWRLSANGTTFDIRFLDGALDGEMYLVNRAFVGRRAPLAERSLVARSPGWTARVPATPPVPLPAPFGR